MATFHNRLELFARTTLTIFPDRLETGARTLTIFLDRLETGARTSLTTLPDRHKTVARILNSL